MRFASESSRPGAEEPAVVGHESRTRVGEPEPGGNDVDAEKGVHQRQRAAERVFVEKGQDLGTGRTPGQSQSKVVDDRFP
jgi:hypothetical protein